MGAYLIQKGQGRFPKVSSGSLDVERSKAKPKEWGEGVGRTKRSMTFLGIKVHKGETWE